MNRCPWAASEPNISYHDREWGVPVRDDLKQTHRELLDSLAKPGPWLCGAERLGHREGR